MAVHPGRGLLGDRQNLRIVGNAIERGQSADRPAVLARIDMAVDAGQAEFAAILVAERIIAVSVRVAVEIGILADIEGAVGALKEAREIAPDVARRDEIFWI